MYKQTRKFFMEDDFSIRYLRATTDYLIYCHCQYFNRPLIEFSAERSIKATTWGTNTTPNFCNHDFYLQHTATYDTNREE